MHWHYPYPRHFTRWHQLSLTDHKKIMYNNYRRKVAFIKYSFLVIAGLLLISVYFVSGRASNVVKKYDEDRSEKIYHFKKIKDQHSFSISKTIFKGFSEDKSPYQILAGQVDKVGEEKFYLKNIDANYEISTGDLKINALSGIFNNQKSEMLLKNGVTIKIEDLVMTTEEISIDIQTREAISNNEVDVKYKNSEISADRFRAKEDADIIEFDGNVHSRFNVSDF